MNDRACTRCHEDIAQHSPAGQYTLPPDARRVTRFDAQTHPQFTPVAGNPKHLRFSHQRHLTPGLVSRPDGKDPMTLGRFQKDSAQRKRYGRGQTGDSSLVQLDCASCHQLDGIDFGADGLAGLVHATLPARPGSGYMLPIVYENQCQACHPLYKTPGLLQHRQTPDEIRAALQRKFAKCALDGSPELLRTPVPPQSLPNARLPGSETIKKKIDNKAETAEREIADGACGKCHEFKTSGQGLQPVVPPNVPQIWYLHAKFDHRAHRAMNCLECHAIVQYNDVKEAESKYDVQLPSLEVCLRCHSPASTSGSTITGGARFDCVECHRYHNGAALLAGSGAQAGDPAIKLNQEEFQSGDRQPQVSPGSPQPTP